LEKNGRTRPWGEGQRSEKTKSPAVQTAVRLNPDLPARLDAIAAKLSRSGLGDTRADAIRIALMTGLEKIEKE
jgi:predicted DNA-binding protein